VLQCQAKEFAEDVGVPVRHAMHTLRQQTSPRPPLRSIDRRTEKQLLAWCRHNGLPGLLHHQIAEVVLAPVWQDPMVSVFPDTEAARTMLRQTEPDWDWPRALQPYLAFRRGWVWGWKDPALRTSDRSRKDQRLTAEEAAGLAAPHGSYRSIVVGTDDATERLPGRWSRFVPGLDVEDAVAQFNGEAFWRSYSEPLEDLVSVITRVDLALESLRDMQRYLAEGHERDFCWSVGSAALTELNNMRGVVSHMTWLDEDFHVRVGWAAPSLLAILLTAVLSDVAGGQRVVRCVNCGTFFLSKASQARYCSSRCRATFHKRQWRKGQSDEGDQQQ
jgi:hypothetical protein